MDNRRRSLVGFDTGRTRIDANVIFRRLRHPPLVARSPGPALAVSVYDIRRMSEDTVETVVDPPCVLEVAAVGVWKWRNALHAMKPS